MTWRKGFALTTLLVFQSVRETAGAVSACPSAATLGSIVSCLLDSEHMPGEGSNGFVVPSDTDLDDWYDAVWDMLTIASTSTSSTSNCGSISLQGNLASLYEYVTFTDGTVNYCVLAETALVGQSTKKGWGTFLTRLKPTRNLHFQVPHPLFDVNTGTQNADVFEGTEATSFLLTGTHRNANAAVSACQGCGNGDFKESDAAHNVQHMFDSTTRAIQNWHAQQGTNFVVLQLHGFAAVSCATDMFLTYGRPTAPSSGDCLTNLQTNLRANLPDSVISVPGELACECALNGGSNTQGRILNDVDPSQVCSTSASSYSGRFIHIEQEPQFRDSSSNIQAIINAIIATFSTGEECSAQPPGSSGNCFAYYYSLLQETVQRVFFHNEIT